MRSKLIEQLSIAPNIVDESLDIHIREGTQNIMNILRFKAVGKCMAAHRDSNAKHIDVKVVYGRFLQYVRDDDIEQELN